MRWLLPLLLVACDPVEQAPCEVVDDPLLELTPADTPFGEFETGDPLVFGPPPQGGAPFAAVNARVAGLDLIDGVSIELEAEDMETGDELGALSYEARLVCANVGESAGTWLASDVHHRFYGWNLDELAGRSTELVMRITDRDGTVLEQSIEATLVQAD